MNEEVIAVMALVVVLAACAWATVAVVRIRHRRNAVRDAMIGRLVERFGTLPEFVAFARSAEGRALIGTGEAATIVVVRLLWAFLAAGAILGLGLVLLWQGVPPPPGSDINLVRNAEDAHWWGQVLAGVGVVVVACVGVATALVRRWGVVGKDA
jgi:hypothetical protein